MPKLRSIKVFALIIAVLSCVFSLTTILTGCLGIVGLKTYKVGVSIYKFGDNFMTLYRAEIESYFKSLETDKVKYDVTIMDAKGDMNEQASQVDDFISQKFDVMIINLVQSSSADLITQKAKAAKIPCVYINREPSEDDMKAWKKICYVGSDVRQFGSYKGEIIRDLPDHGDADSDGVVRYARIRGNPECIDNNFQFEFCTRELDIAGIQVEELFNRIGWNAAQGQELATDALMEFSDKVDVIFCDYDDMAIGAIPAIKAAGRIVGKDIYLVGADAIPEALAAVAAGDMTGTIFNDYAAQAHAAVDAAIRYINGEDVDTYIWVNYVKITADNAAGKSVANEIG